jgi:hypothetical protein
VTGVIVTNPWATSTTPAAPSSVPPLAKPHLPGPPITPMPDPHGPPATHSG